MDFTIRKAKISDAKALVDIYSYYVKNTAITFEYTVPNVDKFAIRIENTLKKYPYIVAEQNGKILGYAYSGSFIGREAYDHSTELSIYIDHNLRKSGVGGKLYSTLVNILKDMGITNLYACISVPEQADEYLDFNSVEFHKHLGFEIVGRFAKCGYKFDRWYNMVWMGKIISEHKDNMPPLKMPIY